MTTRRSAGATTATLLLLSTLVGCSSAAPLQSVAAVTDAPTIATPTPPPATPAPTPTPATPTPEPTETVYETFPRDQFSDPTRVDNPWLSMLPGTQWIWDGANGVGNDRAPHRLIVTVTDLTKVIDGVLTQVAYDQDFVEGELVEAELAFYAQADDGSVWYLGEYPEEYEDGVFVEAPAWLTGTRGAQAGIMMPAEPRVGMPSYAEGWGPEVGWNDRGRIFEANSRTCVPTGCHDGVLIVDEYSVDQPDAHQYKYYARGVGNVRVGWSGALETTHEELELVSVRTLSPAELADIRKVAFALEASAYKRSPEVYGPTSPLTLR